VQMDCGGGLAGARSSRSLRFLVLLSVALIGSCQICSVAASLDDGRGALEVAEGGAPNQVC